MYHSALRKLMIYPGTDSKLRYTISCFTYVCTAFTARVGNEVSVGQATRKLGIACSEVYVTTKLA